MVDRTMQDALTLIRNNSTRVGSLIQLFNSKKAELEAALKNVMTPEVQSAINDAFDIETSEAADLDTALNANVPPAAPATPA